MLNAEGFQQNCFHWRHRKMVPGAVLFIHWIRVHAELRCCGRMELFSAPTRHTWGLRPRRRGRVGVGVSVFQACPAFLRHCALPLPARFSFALTTYPGAAAGNGATATALAASLAEGLAWPVQRCA